MDIYFNLLNLEPQISEEEGTFDNNLFKQIKTNTFSNIYKTFLTQIWNKSSTN